jgi:hypothetical protein
MNKNQAITVYGKQDLEAIEIDSGTPVCFFGEPAPLLPVGKTTQPDHSDFENSDKITQRSK